MTIVYAFVFLLYFQLIADHVEATYALGLLQTRVPAETAAALVLLSPLLLPFAARVRRVPMTEVLLGLAFAARVAAPLLDTRGRLLAAGFGVAALMLLLPLLLTRRGSGDGGAAAAAAGGLALAVTGSILLRSLGSGIDISMQGWPQLVVWIPAPFVLAALRSNANVASSKPEQRPATGTLLACVGLLAALTLLYFAFTAPNVIARWTEQSQVVIVCVLAVTMAGFASAGARVLVRLNPSAIAGLNAVFVASLATTLLLQQIDFPDAPSSYPVFARAPGAFAWLPLALTLVLSPVLVLDFWICAAQIVEAQPSWGALGRGFTLGVLVMAAAIFGQIFTTSYDYVPVAGPLFRDRFWLVFLALGLAVALPTLATSRRRPLGQLSLVRVGVPVVVLGLLAVLATAVMGPHPTDAPVSSTLRVLTYNIQQGYGLHGQRSLDEQIDVIRSLNADIVALQETDTNRVAGGNRDAVRVIARALKLHSYYGPTPVVGTFGVALLSRFPIENARTFYMYSEGEQVAGILATIRIEGKVLNLVVTHLGNKGPIVQQEAVLRVVASLDNVILAGDFNFRPRDPQYGLTRELLDDAWLLRWPSGVDDLGKDHEDEIDHVFVTRGTVVTEAQYVESAASDHPALVVEIEK